MVHAEGIEEDVDVIVGVRARQAALGGMRTGPHELELGAGRRGAHLVVLAVAEPLEERRQPARLLGPTDHVEVGVVAFAELEAAAVFAHGQAAEQP